MAASPKNGRDCASVALLFGASAYTIPKHLKVLYWRRHRRIF